MKINRNINSLVALNIGFILIAIGIYFWAYWSGWYASNKTCEANWRNQMEIVEAWYYEILTMSKSNPQKSAVLAEFSKAYRRNVTGDMYSGYNTAMPFKITGLALCIIGLFFILSAIANHYIQIPENPSLLKKHKPFIVAFAATILIVFAIGLSSSYYYKNFSNTKRKEYLQLKIALYYFALLDLQRKGVEYAPTLIVENLRSKVETYLFLKNNGTIKENKTCENALKWLTSHDINIAEIKKDGKYGLQKTIQPVRRFIRINNKTDNGKH